jgi:hypothetical protein
VSTESQSPLPDVRIAYHADGSATVNDVAVAVEPGQDVRDAAYQAAVGLVVAAGASGPVAAKSVEADGTEYPLTLYPLKAVAAVNTLVNGAANADSASGSGEAGKAGVVGAGIGGASALEGQFRRARRAWYRPTLSMSWLVAGACACMALSVLATVLMRENDPALVHLQVDTENEVGHSAAARAIGRVMASLPTVAPKPTAKPIASKHRPASTASTHAAASTKASTISDGNGLGSDDGNAGDGYGSDGVSRTSSTSPKSAPSPKPRSAPNPGPVQVTNLTVALVGGDQTGLGIAYVINVNTSNTSPITLTYSYAGKGGRGTIRRSVVLSGTTEYMLANLIPAQPYCGGVVTMTVSTSPAADNGTVIATAQPGC